MRILLAAILLLAGCSVHRPQYVVPPDTRAIAAATLISNVQVFTGFDDFLIEEMDVLLVGGRIRAVVPTGSLRLGERVEHFDGRGRVLLPGLVDMHVLLGSRAPGLSRDPRLQLETLLFHGITTAVVVGHETDVESLQRQVAAGEVAGPRLYRSTRPIRGKGLDPIVALYALDTVQTAGSPRDAARAARRDLERYRSDFVRIDWSGSLSTEAARAVVAEANAYGKPVFASASDPEDAAAAAESGIALLLHPPWTDLLTEEQAHRIALSGVPMVTTFGICPTPGCESNLRENIRRLVQADVPLLSGSGSGTEGDPLEPSLQRGLEELVSLGVSPAAALSSATHLPVRLLDPKAQFGVIAPGAYADLVLVEGNPLEDILALRQVAAIWQAGRQLERMEPPPENAAR